MKLEDDLMVAYELELRRSAKGGEEIQVLLARFRTLMSPDAELSEARAVLDFRSGRLDAVAVLCYALLGYFPESLELLVNVVGGGGGAVSETHCDLTGLGEVEENSGGVVYSLGMPALE
jgi:hypothetical protein